MSCVAVWSVSTVCPPLSPAICSAVNGRTLVSQDCLSVRGSRDSRSVTVTAVITLDFCFKALKMSPPEACCGTRAAKLPLCQPHTELWCMIMSGRTRSSEDRSMLQEGQPQSVHCLHETCSVLSREDAPVDVSSSDASSPLLASPLSSCSSLLSHSELSPCPSSSIRKFPYCSHMRGSSLASHQLQQSRVLLCAYCSFPGMSPMPG